VLLLAALLQDFCPCEHKCNNQMFTRKQYAKLAVVRDPSRRALAVYHHHQQQQACSPAGPSAKTSRPPPA
jgi:hypothetical protein